jgi:hypothetical protein
MMRSEKWILIGKSGELAHLKEFDPSGYFVLKGIE